MAIRPSPINGGPCPKYRASPLRKPKEHPDIKVTSHKQTVQHSVRAQKLDERQLSKLFKSLDDLKIKRSLQIDKEISEQEQILENLNNAWEQRRATRGNSSRSTFADSDLSSLLPDQFKRGRRPSLQRSSSNFDLYAFMMRRASDQAVAPYNVSTIRGDKNSPKKSRSSKQLKKFPLQKSTSITLNKDRCDSGLAKAADVDVLPGKSDRIRIMSTSPVSATSLSRSMSIESPPPSTTFHELNVKDGTAPPTPQRFPSGSDWPSQVVSDVNKDASKCAQQKQQRTAHGTRGPIPNRKGREGCEGKRDLRVDAHNEARTHGSLFGKLKKEVSFHFDKEESQRDALGSTGVALGAGIMEKNNILEPSPVSSQSAISQQECKEPDCIFHNKAYRKTHYSDGDEYTIDDYYRTVGVKSAVSPLFVSASSPRSWSRRGMVRPPSPNLSDFLHDFDQGKTAKDSSKCNSAESGSKFLSVRRPLKGSNRERMLKDKEENVRTTFNLMRQKMADLKPCEFNQNYGTPTPNWKILNPLKMRHKINQSNPLHVRWGL
ncbi:uncharacterized protein LOC110974922 [Acanthaster planci]|uniref:Uncharacterized protein LOC110974922 n=1 Tax=Acanthaster planci TaxID=133434 RepID=A0A8B7XQX8_ACAPL|nr:uncharacterized protein LOC110974922 [Acanthaster planci]